MPRQLLRNAFFIVLEVVAIFLCTSGVKQSAEKATIGRDLLELHTRHGITISQNDGDLQQEDRLITINGRHLYRLNDVEFVLDGEQIGESVQLTVLRNGNERQFERKLTAFYTKFDIVVQMLAAVVLLLIGIYVLSSRPEDPVVVRFNALTVAVACLVCLTSGYYRTGSWDMGYVLRFLFPSMYLWSGALLVDFSLRYALPKRSPHRLVLIVLYALPILATVAGTITAIRALASENLLDAIPYYLTLSAAKGLLSLLGLMSVGIVLWTFLRTGDRLERRRLTWMLGSVGFSVGWFILFWQIPTSIIVRNALPLEFHKLLELFTFPESGILLALVVSCVGLAIGIVRFRLFDIEVLVRRAIVTFIVINTLEMIYLLAMYVITSGFGRSSPTTEEGFLQFIRELITASVLIFAMLLIAVGPIRSITQHIVDKYLFRVEYNYSASKSRLHDSMAHSLNSDSVAAVLIDNLASLLRIERAVLLLRTADGRFHIARGRGIKKRQGTAIALHASRTQTLIVPVYDLGGFCEPVADVPRLDLPAMKRLGFALLALLRGDDGNVSGILALGRKTGLAPFSVEDVELVSELADQAMKQIDRILLQERLTMEIHETTRLRELNRMKTHFVSGVSHDLKTPLTAIRMYTEMISMSPQVADSDTSKYLDVIDGECRRLTRLIDNVLDFTRIEQGRRQYNIQEVDLTEVTRDAVAAMKYQFEISHCEYDLKFHCSACRVSIDPAAIQEALLNVMSNAIKYNGDDKRVIIRIQRDRLGARISVQDFGVGITAEDMPKLFEPFFRSSDMHIQRQGGVGLGLSLVQHIMIAHGGAIDVQSIPERGTTFSLILPMQEVV